MSFAGDDDLHRGFDVRQDANEALDVAQKERRPLVLGETARHPDRERVGIEDVMGRFAHLSPQTRRRKLMIKTLANEPDELGPRLRTQGPQRLVRARGDARSVLHHSDPSLLAARRRPERVGSGRVPARDVHAVGDVPHGDFGFRPMREEQPERGAGSPSRASDSRHSTAPLPRTARYAMLKLSDESFGFWRPMASKS